MGRVLLLTPQLPYPPQQGTSLRNFHILRGLVDGGESVTLLSYLEASQSTDTATISTLENLCERLVTVPAPQRTMGKRLLGLITDRRPDMAHRLDCRKFDEALIALLEEAAGRPYHIVQIEGIELARIIPIVRQHSPASKIVFDNHNAETELQYRAFKTDVTQPRRWPAALYSWLQIGRLRQFERWAGQEADWTVAVSEADKQSLLALGIQRSVAVIPNSIDVREYQSAELDADDGDTVESYDLIFSGKMDYRPNIDAVLWFCQEIWPLILIERPKTTWVIVGQKPHSRLDRLRDMPGVTVTGWVPSVSPYLKKAKVCIMPFRIGSGTRLKLIESMAAGKAVVSTHIGAEGFNVIDGQDLVLANGSAEFAGAVLSLLASSETRDRLGTAAQEMAQAYDWRAVVPAFLEIYANLAS